MNMQNFREGLEILSRYFDKPDGYHGGAEHDQFYVYKTDRPVTPEDIKKLIDLNWFQEGADYEDEFGVEHYDPEESWTAYF